MANLPIPDPVPRALQVFCGDQLTQISHLHSVVSRRREDKHICALMGIHGFGMAFPVRPVAGAGPTVELESVS